MNYPLLTLARLNADIYKKLEKADSYGCDSIEVYNVENERFAFLTSGEDLIVVICGSNDKPDWLENISFVFPVRWNDFLAHRGFVQGVGNILPKVMVKIANCKRVVVSGHSAGAAKSSLIAHYLYTQHYQVQLVTFACPKHFSKFAKKVRNMLPQIHVKGSDDIVPSLLFVTYRDILGQYIILDGVGHSMRDIQNALSRKGLC